MSPSPTSAIACWDWLCSAHQRWACYVAAGRLHAYFHLNLQLWDVAAAAVILQESGAIFTTGAGSSWLYSDGSYFATNGRLHGGMLRLLRAALPEDLK